MKLVAHEAIDVDLPALSACIFQAGDLGAGLAEGSEEALVPAAPVHHMVNGPSLLDSEPSGPVRL